MDQFDPIVRKRSFWKADSVIRKKKLTGRTVHSRENSVYYSALSCAVWVEDERIEAIFDVTATGTTYATLREQKKIEISGVCGVMTSLSSPSVTKLLLVCRTLRLLPLSGVSSHTISTFNLLPCQDKEWESNEYLFHKESIETLNKTLRKYNGIAPYSVRRRLVTLENELEKCFRDGKADILTELRRRLTDGNLRLKVQAQGADGRKEKKPFDGEEEEKVDESMWKGFRRLVKQVLGNEEGVMVESKKGSNI